MKTFHFYSILIVVIFTSVSCKNSGRAIFNSIPDYNQIDTAILSSAIKAHFQDSKRTDPAAKWTKQWYFTHSYQPLWTRQPINSFKLDTLLLFISQVQEHGLCPEQFGFKTISSLKKQLVKQKLSYNQLAELELTASRVYLEYCGGLRFGFINPKKTCPNYYFQTLQINETFTNSYLKGIANYLFSHLSKAQPTDENYLVLQELKKKFKNNPDSAQYVDKINVNLERLRWKIKSLGSKYIRVNVADMTLTAFRNDSVALKMKVVVGKAPHNRTPFLQSSIYQLIINPTWTVPSSIVVKEIAKLALIHEDYFERHNIHVYRHGEEIDPTTIDWSKVSKTNQPYKLIQASGSNNSLGRIKFVFGNRFSVYLHDTNAKGAFYRSNRALSHGCVRVERPLELASFCLADVKPDNLKKIEKKNLMLDKIRYSMDLNVVSAIGRDSLRSNPKGMKISRIRLSPCIPVLLDYNTCFRNARGEVQFRNDIYKVDSVLSRRLKNL